MMKKRFLKEFGKHFLFGSTEFMIKIYKKANPYLEKGCIVDIETTGLNPGKGDYYTPASSVVTLGVYQGDLIRIYQLAKPNYIKFLAICRKIIERSPTPRYAYAAHFEQSFLGVFNGWQDLTRYREVEPDGWEPYRNYRYRLVDVTRNPCPTREDWDIDGEEVPARWSQWLTGRQIRDLAEISYHCYIDLLRERQLV